MDGLFYGGTMNKDYQYWKQQIESAKSSFETYFKNAETCEKEYSAKDKNYNIFYSNVQTLDANLCLANPKPDIQRRFLKQMEAQKIKSNAYAEVAKILSSSVEYISDISDVDSIIKKDVHNCSVVGRGIVWVDYYPHIVTNADGKEEVISREIRLDSLKYDEYLCSTAESEKDVWWKARRHLLTRKDIYDRFGYSAGDFELQFKPYDKNETVLKRGEVWEIWDKNSKKRIFLLMNHQNHELLEEKDDPYKLECFFPCDEICFVTENNSVIPVPEYLVYKKQADLLETVSKKIALISDEIKYVVISGSQDKSVADKIGRASNGSFITIQSNDVTANIAQMLTTLPVESATNMIEYLNGLKDRIRQNIYDITGISDLMRGASDPRETAKAQQIKGLFGSLRFQARQTAVQQHRKRIYRIIAEIIAEHYDKDTLSEMTGTYLPDIEEKARMEAEIKNVAPENVPEDLIQRYNEVVNLPTWGDVIQILRSDRLRNYTVDIETTATAFDDHESQTEAIDKITQTYITMAKMASELSPELVKGFVPIIKMNLSNCKLSSAITRQLEEAMDAAYREVEQSAKQPPQPTPEQQRIQANMQLENAKLQTEKEKHVLNHQVELKRLEIEASKLQNERFYKDAEIALKKEEEDRKNAELQAQIYLEQEKLDKENTSEINIAGDVKDLV